MRCEKCSEEKLSEEFPPVNPSTKCSHYIPYCLRCMIEFIEYHGHCPVEECHVAVRVDSKEMKWYRGIIESMFGEDEDEDAADYEKEAEMRDVNICTLQGEHFPLTYTPEYTVEELKQNLRHKFNIEPLNQKLIFEDKELKDGKISQYNIPNHAEVYLVVKLYTVTENIQRAIFDLSWEYPEGFFSKNLKIVPDALTNYLERKFVDASCFLLSGDKIMEVVDHSHTKSRNSECIIHSRSMLTNANRKGHQTIDVKFHDIPKSINTVFFTLSARDCSSIAVYPNPSLQFYENDKKQNVLCETTIPNNIETQGLIMCYMTRSKVTHGSWEIYKCGKSAPGNVKKYDPLKKEIIHIIKHGWHP